MQEIDLHLSLKIYIYRRLIHTEFHKKTQNLSVDFVCLLVGLFVCLCYQLKEMEALFVETVARLSNRVIELENSKKSLGCIPYNELIPGVPPSRLYRDQVSE